MNYLRDFPRVFSKCSSPLAVDDPDITGSSLLKMCEKEVQPLLNAMTELYNVAHIEFTFTYGTQIGAFAASKGENRIVGITHGFALCLLRYFQCALCHDNLYTDFLRIKSGPEPIKNVKDIGLYTASHVPQDASLNRLAEGLARFALVYIAGHEAGHIVLGHLRGADTGAELTWDEEEKVAISDFDQIAREVAVDRFASQFMFNYLNNFEGSLELRFMIMVTYQAILSLFQFDTSHKNWSTKLLNDQGTHPPAQFRSQVAVSGLSILANETGLVDVPNALTLSSLTVELAVKLQEGVTGVKRTREEGEEYARFIPFVSEQISRLFARHRELYPESLLENAAN